MKTGIFRLVCFASVLAMILCLAPAALWGQSGNQGSVVVTAQDGSGAIIPGADLELLELRSNSARKAQTGDKGTYTFVNLNIGVYRLTISHAGYQTKIYDAVLVESSSVTPVVAALPVGAVTETVRISAEATGVLETSSTELSTVINTKEIENLPLSGRSVTQLSSLVAGYNGTYNGVPSPNQGTNIDGMIGSSSRMKFGGNASPAVSPRIESFEQMSVVSDGLSLGNGFGQASTQINLISRRGSNQFHGRAYYDFRNSGLNANSYANNASGVRRSKLILHDFGGSVGGPIIKDKLFFFGTFAMSKQPGTKSVTNSVLTPSAQQGLFTYNDATNSKITHTVNVYQLAQNYNPAFAGTQNAIIAAQLKSINGAVNGQGLTPVADPTLNTVQFNVPNATTVYYPVARVDYNLSDKVRMYLSWLMTRSNQQGNNAQPFPGATYANQNGGNYYKNYQSSFGLDYIISPTIVNQFKFGFLYDYTTNVAGVPALWETNDVIAWNMTGQVQGNTSGQNYALPTANYYPLFSLTDNVTYQHGGHTYNFGFQGYREQDHYYNAPVGFNIYNLGVANSDPLQNAFTYTGANPTLPGGNSTSQGEAEQLYAVLTGRVNTVSGSYAFDPKIHDYSHGHGGYTLDELAFATGIWFQDSWKILPTLTLNYGMRWDFTTDTHDLTSQYTSSTLSNIYGPTAPSDLFKPGALNGVANPAFTTNAHPYHGWYKSPQPSFGFAWNPKAAGDGFLGKLMGNGTVVRANFGLRNFTEPYQYFWDAATSYGSFYYQQFGLTPTPNASGQAGTFAPGSLSLGNTLPAFAYSPSTFQTTAPQSQFTFVNGTGAPPVTGLNPNVRQPYTESWTLGIQRELGQSRVLEVRYNGSRTLHHWVQLNLNETNIFENGFLDEFKRAQGNLRTVNGKQTFSDVGAPNKTPLLDAAFGGAGTANFSATQFINYLNNGQVGSFANVLAGDQNRTPTYFCNLVGGSFAPCQATHPGAGYGSPINIFNANPYSPGRPTNYMTDAGYSNYNALQVEFRQASWHGLQYQFNYTWSHTLGFESNNGYDASIPSFYTLRNFSLAYQPTLFDIAQVTHAYGTYDLPFGKGRTFLNQNALVDRVVGGWSLGTVITFQTGTPFRLTGGYSTYNATADGGVTLPNGVTSGQLQKAIGVHRVAGRSTANLIDAKYLSTPTGGTSNTSLLAPNTTPGTLGQIINLHGPHQFSQNLAITKSIPVKDQYRFSLQGEFLNVWNHPYFGFTGGSTQSLTSTSFMSAGVPSSNTPRTIELRANFEF